MTNRLELGQGISTNNTVILDKKLLNEYKRILNERIYGSRIMAPINKSTQTRVDDDKIYAYVYVCSMLLVIWNITAGVGHCIIDWKQNLIATAIIDNRLEEDKLTLNNRCAAVKNQTYEQLTDNETRQKEILAEKANGLQTIMESLGIHAKQTTQEKLTKAIKILLGQHDKGSILYIHILIYIIENYEQCINNDPREIVYRMLVQLHEPNSESDTTAIGIFHYICYTALKETVLHRFTTKVSN